MTQKIKILIFITLIGTGVYYAFYQGKELKRNHTVTKGNIYNVEFLAKSSDCFVSFTFKVSDNEIVAKSSIPYIKWDDLHYLYTNLKGKNLTVIYQSNNPDNCLMLFRKEQYKEYGLEIPNQDMLIINLVDSLTRASK